jgi:peptidoglycan/LPS O-acetylase OafA/YrhL
MTDRSRSTWDRVYRASVFALGGFVVLLGAYALITQGGQPGAGPLNIAVVVAGVGMLLVGAVPWFWRTSPQG